MNQAAKVTDNTHEMSFHELFSQSTQVQIPLFQRAYVWGQGQLQRLLDEIEIISEGEDSNRFLGAVIAVRRDANPAAPQPYEIVDGQQRLTTLYLFVLACAYVAAKEKHEDYALGLINSNLIIDWWKSGPNTKLISSYADRAQFTAVFRQTISVGSIKDQISSRVVLPPETGDPDGKLVKQFNRVRKYIQKIYDNKGISGVQEIVIIAQTKLTFVFILLKDASTATTVFEGLNDPGIPIGIGDLVRNEIFARVSSTPEKAHYIHEQCWIPFRKKLGDNFDNYFFSY